MKKFFITLFVSILIGVSMGVYAHYKFKQSADIPVARFNNEVYAIQAGVFDTVENATKMAENYGGLIVNDNNKYRVYLAITSSSLNNIKNYFDNKGISYYVKNINGNNDFYNTLIDYESLLNATTEDNYEQIIKNILKEYEKNET